MTLSVTKADILSFAPCDSESIARIDELFSGRERLTAFGVLELDMPDDHKLWLVLRPELIGQDSLDAIKIDLVGMIPVCSPLREIAIQKDVRKVPSRVIHANRITPDDDLTDDSILSRMVEIVRHNIA